MLFFSFLRIQISPTVEAALRLQPRCSEKVDRDSGLTSLTTRLLVPTSRIGCLIGKRGTIINEMRKIRKLTFIYSRKKASQRLQLKMMRWCR